MSEPHPLLADSLVAAAGMKRERVALLAALATLNRRLDAVCDDPRTRAALGMTNCVQTTVMGLDLLNLKPKTLEAMLRESARILEDVADDVASGKTVGESLG